MSELERLRSLLLSPERERIAAAEARADTLQQRLDRLPADLPELLEAAQRDAGEGRLGRALAEPVADALGEAVVRRRDSIVDALFPVIMPAIRRAIAESLRVLSADINRLLESSFTARGIGWRIEGWRTGLPYAEIALKHSLRYRVDHLLLIQRDSGLVLDRESAADLPAPDADAIAGMLTAIGDFVRDSVAAEGEGTLSSATVGEHLLWVLEGPHVSLAAFIRGVPPQELKDELQARLEALHARFGDQLALPPQEIDGIAQVKDALTPDDLRSSQGIAEVAAPGSSRLLWYGLAGLLLVLAVIVAAGWRWQLRVDAAAARLRQWPGFHLTELDTRLWRSVHVRGLIDPLAESPLPYLRGQAFDGIDVTADLRGYVSTDPAIAAERIRRVLDLPDGVSVTVAGDTARLQGSAGVLLQPRLRPEAVAIAGLAQLDTQALRWDLAASLRESIGVPQGVQVTGSAAGWRIEGRADAGWRSRLDAWLAARAAAFGAVDTAALVAGDVVPLDAINASLRELPLRFSIGVVPEDGGAARVDEIAALIARAQETAPAGASLHVDLYGGNDPSGSAGTNAALRAARARYLEDALRARADLRATYQSHVDSPPALATIRSRAAMAQLRFE